MHDVMYSVFCVHARVEKLSGLPQYTTVSDGMPR